MTAYEQGQLKNGLKYIYIPNPHIMTFTLAIAFKVGSRDEKDDVFGYSHLLEHMLFKGTTRRPKAKDISEEFEILGGSFNATTSQCITNYYIKAPSENIEKCMDLLFDIAFNSIIRSVDLETEKKVVVEEYNKMIDSPMATCVELCIKEVFKDHKLGQSVIGTKESIMGFDRGRLYEYYKHFYTPSNCTVSIAGNTKGMDNNKIKSLLEKYTHHCPENLKNKKSNKNKKTLCQNITSTFANPKQSVSLEIQTRPRLHVEKRDSTQQCAIMLGYPCMNRYNINDIYALRVAASILGGGLSSRLFVAVREKAGLAYTIKADTIYFQDAGMFMITTAIEKNSLLFSHISEDKIDITNQNNIHQTGIASRNQESVKPKKEKQDGGLSIILNVLENVLRDGVSYEEVERSKTNIVNKLSMSYEDTHAIALYYNEIVMMEHENIITIEEFIKGITNIKLSDVNKIIKEYLSFEKMTLCVVGNYDQSQIMKYLSDHF